MDSGGTIAAVTSLVGVLRDALGRVVWIREEYEQHAREVALEDLEGDLAAQVERWERWPA